jgi:membrane-associated protease RseP (regulator of RpoE activity)
MILLPLFSGLILLVIVSAIHELGHAFAMKKYGVAIEEICLCGIGKKLCTFRIHMFFGDTPITVRLIPISAFVRANAYSLAKLRQSNPSAYVHVLGAGISNNLLLAAILFSATTPFTVMSTVFYCILSIPFFTTKHFSYLYPIIGGLVTYIICRCAFTDFHSFVNDGGSAIKVVSGAAKYAKTISSYLNYMAYISLSIALFNCIPASILDGGKISILLFERMLQDKKRLTFKVFNILTVLPILLLVLLSIIMDVFHILHRH